MRVNGARGLSKKMIRIKNLARNCDSRDGPKRDMAKVSKPGLTEVHMRDIGKMISQMEEDACFLLTEIFIMGSIKMANLT